MPAFRFRYQTLLEHRRRERDGRQRDLANLMSQRGELEAELAAMQRTISSAKGELRASLTGRVDLSAVGSFARYSGQSTIRGRQIVQQLAALTQGVEAARAALLEASRAFEALERLRERHRREWQTTQDRREQEQLDELATQRYANEQIGHRGTEAQRAD